MHWKSYLNMIGTLVCDYQVWARIPYYKLNIYFGVYCFVSLGLLFSSSNQK